MILICFFLIYCYYKYILIFLSFTLFRVILGDFDFNSLEAANRVLGPMFFLSYVFLVFFVLLNMFIAIINDTYAEIKEELANEKSEIELTSFLKKGYDKVLDKLDLKKAQIVDIQKVTLILNFFFFSDD